MSPSPRHRGARWAGAWLLAAACSTQGARAPATATTTLTRVVGLTDIAALPPMSIRLPRLIDGTPDIASPAIYILTGGALRTGLVGVVTVGAPELVREPQCAGAVERADGRATCRADDGGWSHASRVHAGVTIACLARWTVSAPLDEAQTRSVADLESACATLAFEP